MAITLDGSNGVTTPRAYVDSGSGYNILQVGANDSTGYHIVNEGSSLNIYNGAIGAGSKYLSVDSAGRVTMPYQPLFAATGNWANTLFAQGTRINMDTLMVSRSNNYDTSIGRFTAPVDGVYRFSLNLYCYNGYHNSIVLRINGAEPAWTGDTMLLTFQPASANTSMRSGTLTYQLSAGDYVELYQRNSSGNASLYGKHSSFSGYLVA